MRSLWAWLRGRRADVGPDDVAIGYARDQTPFLLAMAGLLAVETAVVGFLVPWPIVHVLDVCAVLQVLGIAANLVVHPHVVGSRVLLLREGRRFTVRVPLDAITSVRAEQRTRTGRTRQLDGEELSIAVGNQTDVLVELSRPIPVRKPDGVATRIRFRADDPRHAVTVIRRLADPDAGQQAEGEQLQQPVPAVDHREPHRGAFVQDRAEPQHQREPDPQRQAQ
jgi:hypothetical protein